MKKQIGDSLDKLRQEQEAELKRTVFTDQSPDEVMVSNVKDMQTSLMKEFVEDVKTTDKFLDVRTNGISELLNEISEFKKNIDRKMQKIIRK